MNRADRRTMAWRTRVFARLLKLSERGIETVTDLPGHRAKRARLQRSAVGRFVFGAPSDGVEVTTLEHAGRRALVYRPRRTSGPLPLVVNFHGGGWVQGNPEQSGWLASRLAERAGVVVVSPAYRLAPEDPYPAGVDDAWESLTWLVDHADELDADPERVVVMGDSAGGNLAAVVAQRARALGGPALRGQVLIYPGVEMYDKYPSEIRHAEAPVLTSANMRAFVRLYLGDAYGTEDVEASPIRAESFAELPPALIVTAALDPLLDNGVRYRDALSAAGGSVEYREHPGAIHGFISLPGVVPAADQALRQIVDFVRRHCDSDGVTI